MVTYHWNGEDYQQHSQNQQKWARELIAKLHLRGSEKILDIGCGDGKITAEIAQSLSTGSIIGIDSSPAMIKLASKLFPKDQYANLSFEIIDAKSIDHHEQFDIVFSNAALHWIKDHEPVLRNIYKSLHPEGKILLQMGGAGNSARLISVITSLKETETWSRYLNNMDFPYGFYSKETYQKLLKDIGFFTHRVELIPKDMEHDGKTGLEGWIRTTWMPYTNKIPESKRDDFIRDIVKKYLELEPLDSRGKAHVAMVRLEVEAERPY